MAGGKKGGSDKGSASAIGENAIRSGRDRPDDPLFVSPPDIEGLALESMPPGADDYSFLLESICGVADDSQPVEQYDGSLGVPAAFVASHQAAVCQVQWNDNLASLYTNPGNVSGVRWGTGTMITDDIMITCGHLFDQTGGNWSRPRQNGTTNIITPQEIARNMRANFNFQVDSAGNLRPEQSFPILELLEYRLGGLDMAICRIGGNPGATFGRTAVSTTDAAKPDMICIIGHPEGRPKRIEAGPTTKIEGNLIRYNDIDTLGGNSGSGILRASDGRLVGIHTNGGCNAASPAGEGSNFGQRIAAVIAASPVLQRLVGPKTKLADDPVTLKFRDDLKSKVSDDPGIPKKLRDDPITLKFRDDPKSKVSDDPGGIKKLVDDPVTLKFRDDVPKAKISDDPKLKFIDDPGGFKKIVDDPVKTPALDKAPGSDGLGGRPPLGGGRPFVLSTPHHSELWGGGEGEAQSLAHYEQALQQLADAMAGAEEQLAQLDAEYRRLLVEYEEAAARSGQNPGG